MITSTGRHFARPKEHTRELVLKDIVFIAACCLVYLWSAWVQAFNDGPDEALRFLVSRYIFFYHMLPTGWDAGARFGAISLAFRYVSFFPAIISAFFMQIASFFTDDLALYLFAARLTSVLFATLTVVFAAKTSHLLFRGGARWIFLVLMALIPQFIFIAGYVNNDGATVLGGIVVLYSWARARNEGWQTKCCVVLALGLSVCILSYYNAYGWAPASLVFFFWLSHLRHDELRVTIRRAGIVFAIVALCVGPLMVRNAILYNGDVIGMKTQIASSNQIIQEAGITASQPDTIIGLGYSLGDLLANRVPELYSVGNWVKMSFESSVGYFGYMYYRLPNSLYMLYAIIFGAGILGSLVKTVASIGRRSASKETVLMCGCLLIAAILVLAVDAVFSIYGSFQPQGRYLYPALPVAIYFVAKGYSFFADLFGSSRVEQRLSMAFCICFVVLTLFVLVRYFYPTASQGLPPTIDTLFTY